MTRKDYVAFAEAIRVLRWQLSREEWELVRNAAADDIAGCGPPHSFDVLADDAEAVA